MKHIIYIFVPLIPAILLASCAADKTPVQLPSGTEEVIVDQIYYDKEENAELAVMRVGDAYLTYSKDGTGWAQIFGKAPDGITLNDGGFGLMTADITRVSGGEAGYGGEPQIDRLISFKPISFEKAEEYAGLEKYDPKETYCHSPEICGEYYIVYIYPEFHIYRDGALVGTYDNVVAVQAAMGLSGLDDDTVEIKDKAVDSVTVMRVGDTYLSYSTSTFMNRYWTPILDSDLQNDPTDFELNDGEAVTVIGEYSVLNGGEAGYVNVPMLRKVREVKYCDYDSLISRTDSIPWFGTWESSSYGESSAEYGTRIYLDQQTDIYSAFERRNGTWLIFYVDSKYRVYHDDINGNVGLYGIYDTSSEVDDIILGQ